MYSRQLRSLILQRIILVHISRCWHWKLCLFSGLRESIADFYTFPLQCKSEQRESKLTLFYLNILSCTVLCDPDLLQLLNPCLILIIRVIPLTSVLRCLHKLRLQLRLNHYYWSSTIRKSRKRMSHIKIRRFNAGLNKIQREFLSV